jgi:hypothetical protein
MKMYVGVEIKLNSLNSALHSGDKPACCVVYSDMVPRTTSLDTNTPIHNILSTAPQLSISQKALGTLPEDGNVMSKQVGATIHN